MHVRYIIDIVLNLTDACSVVLALADADPLGVNTNVTFDEVGGLDDRMCLSQIYYLSMSHL